MPRETQVKKADVISLEKYRGKRAKLRGLTHDQVQADPDPPTIRGWLQNGAPQTQLDNVAPADAGRLLFVALSLCIDLALLAQQSAPQITQSIDLTS